jgi:hypothetical protein
LVILGIALAGCGSSSSSTSTPSPQQLDNQQRDIGYVRAINQIMAPFSKPPANLTDYAAAERKLRQAVTQLGALKPPAPFAPSQVHLVAGLSAQAALAPQMAHATAVHDAVTLSNLEVQTVTAETEIRAATQGMVTAYNGCQSAGFRTC